MDIGVLTGRVEIEDYVTNVLDNIGTELDKVSELFEGWSGVVIKTTGASVAAIAAVTGALIALGEHGSDVNDVTASLETLSGSAERSRGMIDEMSRATLGTIDNFTLMKDATRALSTGAATTTQDLQSLSEASIVLANKGFGTAQEELQMLTSALATGRTRALQAQLGVIDLKQAEADYAASIGLTANELTKEQKLFADQQAIYQRLNEETAKAGEQHRSFAQDITAASTAIRNFYNDLSSQIAASPVIMKALEDIGAAFSTAFSDSRASIIQTITSFFETFASVVSAVAPVIGLVARAFVELSGFITDHLVLIGTLAAAWGAWSLLPGAVASGIQLLAGELVTFSGSANIAAAATLLWDEAIGGAAIAPFLSSIGLLITETIAWTSTADVATAASLAWEAALALVSASPFLSAIGLMITEVVAWESTADVATAASLVFSTALDGITASVSAMSMALLATPLGVVSLLVGLGAGLWELAGAFKGVYQAYEEGGATGVWNFLTAKHDDNFVRWLFGMSDGIHQLADSDLKALNHALDELKDKSGNYGTALDAIETETLKLANAGQLTNPVMQDIAAKLAAAHVQADELHPAVLAVVNAVNIQKQSALDAAAATREHEQAMKDAAKAAEDFAKKQDALNAKIQAMGEAQAPLSPALVNQARQWYDYHLNAEDAALAMGHNAQEVAVLTYQLKPLFEGWDKSAKAAAEHAKALQKTTDAYNALKSKLLEVGSAFMPLAPEEQQELEFWIQHNATLDQAATLMHMLPEQIKPAYDAIVANAKAANDAARAYQNWGDRAKDTYNVMATMKETGGTLKPTVTKFGTDTVTSNLPENFITGTTYYGGWTKLPGGTGSQLAQPTPPKDTTDSMLKVVSQGINKIGSEIGGSTGALIKGVSTTMSTYESLQKIAKSQGTMAGEWGMGTLLDKNASATAKVADVANKAAAVIGGVSSWMQASQQGGTGARLLGESQAGAQAGAAFGPYGMAVGAAAGFVAGLIKGKPQWESIQGEVASKYGAQISQQTSQGIVDAASQFGGSKQAATISQLGSIIKDVGGLTKTNVEQMTGALHDVFSMIGTGQMNIAQGTKVLDDNWDAFTKAGTDSYGVLNKSLVDIIKLQQQYGTQSEAITNYLGSQGKTAVTAFGNAVGVAANAMKQQSSDTEKLASLNEQLASATGNQQQSIQQQIQAVNADLKTQQGIISATAITSQATADAVAGGVAASFAQMIASGTSFGNAIAAIEPAIDGLKTQMDAAGLSGSAVFNELQSEVALYSDAVAGPALSATDQLTQGMVALGNMGQLNQQSFAALTDQIGVTFNSLVDQGQNGDTVLLGMRDSIQRVWEEEQQYGYVADDTTQALVDQAVQEGIVGEKHKSVNDQMLDASNKMVDVLTLIATTLGAKIPDAAGNAAKSVSGLGAAANAAADTTARATAGMVSSYQAVESAATGAAVGHSPGGVREITTQMMVAQRTAETAFPAIKAQLDSLYSTTINTNFAPADLQKAAQDFANSQSTLVDQWKQQMTAIASVAKSFNNYRDSLVPLTHEQEILIDQAHAVGASVTDIATAYGLSTIAVQNYVAASDKQNNALATLKANTDAYTASLIPLTDEQKTEIDQAHAMGSSAADIAAAFNLSAIAVQNYTSATDKHAAALQALQDDTKNYNQSLVPLTADQEGLIALAHLHGSSVANIAEAYNLNALAVQNYITVLDNQNKALATSNSLQAGQAVALGATAQAAADAADLQNNLSGSVVSGLDNLVAFNKQRLWETQNPQYLATGGEVVPFEPQGTDTVPAMLTPGERVLSVTQNQQYEQNIEGPSNQDIVDSVNGLRSDFNSKMPRALARSLHAALVGLRTAS